MSQTGIIFDISHYMLEDGPGIRTNVFLKGCWLHCKWCSNAFGLEQQIQMAFQKQKCTGCGACLNVCEHQAIQWNEKEHVVMQDFKKCINCMKCVSVCLPKARNQIGRLVAAGDVLREVEKDRMFYRRGEGGVTLSGGEILMQPLFAKEILRLCQRDGINTAIESSAFGRWEDLSEIIKLCNTVFLDCKCMNRERHRELTGVYNDIILANIRQAAMLCEKRQIKLVVRLPLIPTMNDSVENIRKTAEFVQTLAGSPLLNILPYHKFGAAKYEYIGKLYETENVNSQTVEELKNIREILDASGVHYSVGGYDI